MTSNNLITIYNARFRQLVQEMIFDLGRVDKSVEGISFRWVKDGSDLTVHYAPEPFCGPPTREEVEGSCRLVAIA